MIEIFDAFARDKFQFEPCMPFWGTEPVSCASFGAWNNTEKRSMVGRLKQGDRNGS